MQNRQEMKKKLIFDVEKSPVWMTAQGQTCVVT